MTDIDNLNPGSVLAEASVADFISELGLGIARAQRALDTNSVDQLAEYIVPIDALDGKSLLDLGLSPAFYHYQHADIALSMQLSLKVEKEFGVKLNLSGSLNDASTESKDESSSSSSSSSGSSSVKVERDAKVEIEAASAGSLTVGDSTHALAGDSPRQRIAALKAAIEAANPEVIPLVVDEPAAAVTLTPENLHADDEDKVEIGGNTVAYVFGGFNAALVKVENDDATDYRLNSANTASIPAGEGSGVAHADALVADINTNLEGYSARRLSGADGVMRRVFFPTGDHDVFTDPNEHDAIRNVAQTAEAAGIGLTVEGFTDRQRFQQNSDENNVKLGNARGKHVVKLLRADGFTGAIENRASRGTEAAVANGDSQGQDDQNFRKTDITVTDGGVYVLIERTDSSKPAIGSVSPDSGTGNRFLPPIQPDDTHQFKAASRVAIQGSSETYGLAARNATDATLLEADAATHAQQLAARVNADSAAFSASQNGNVVTVFGRADKFTLTLVSVSTQKFELGASEAITVTQEFKRSASSAVTAKRTGNRTVAVAGSVDVGFSRKFEVAVTGNSSISARLVSLPAPPEFLGVIKEYLGD